MGVKQIAYSQAAREHIRAGVSQLAKAVKVTLGPTGRVVMLAKGFGAPLVTKDGVTVAKEIELEEPYENMGAQMVKEVSAKTSDVAGDGTTTATILAEAIFEQGLKQITAGGNAQDLRRGVELAAAEVSKQIGKMSKKISGRTEIEHVANIAANGDTEVGTLIADAMERVGKDGVITVDEAKSMETYVEWVEGMQMDRGYLSPHFVTDPKERKVVLEDAYILIYEKKIGSVENLIPILEQVAQSGKPLLIIAEDVEGEALAALVVNKLRGTLKVAAIKAPGFGDRRNAMMEDIALLTGGDAIFEALGVQLEQAQLKTLGTAKRILIDKDTTTLIEGGGKAAAIQGRMETIKREIETASSDYDKEKLQERLAKLAGGVAQIRVGGATEVEVKERKARVEDALHATRAALEEGFLPGGGVALLRIADKLGKLGAKGDVLRGVEILKKALESPLRQLAANCDLEGATVVDKVRANKGANYGFDAATGAYCDLISAGIIDPAKVTRSAVENAASIASLLLTTEAIIAEEPEEAAHAGHGHDHGMM